MAERERIVIVYPHDAEWYAENGISARGGRSGERVEPARPVDPAVPLESLA